MIDAEEPTMSTAQREMLASFRPKTYHFDEANNVRFVQGAARITLRPDGSYTVHLVPDPGMRA